MISDRLVIDKSLSTSCSRQNSIPLVDRGTAKILSWAARSTFGFTIRFIPVLGVGRTLSRWMLSLFSAPRSVHMRPNDSSKGDDHRPLAETAKATIDFLDDHRPSLYTQLIQALPWSRRRAKRRRKSRRRANCCQLERWIIDFGRARQTWETISSFSFHSRVHTYYKRLD